MGFSKLPQWTDWADFQSIEPVEKNSKILKECFLNSKDSKIKQCTIMSLDQGEMTKTGQSAPIWMGFSELPRWTGWAGCKPIEPVEKNSQIFAEYSLNSKESNKKWYTILSSDEGETTKTIQSAPIELGFNELQLNWSFVLFCFFFFGDPNLYLVAWHEPRNWPWWHFIMDQTIALNRTIGEPTWGSKIDWAQQGLYGHDI